MLFPPTSDGDDRSELQRVIDALGPQAFKAIWESLPPDSREAYAYSWRKVARPKQDMRFDVPTIGPNTIRNLKDAKCICLVIEAGRTLIVDKPTTLQLADTLKIAVVGIKPSPIPQQP